MRFLRFTLAASFLALPLALTGASPAEAKMCRCLAILSSGYCTQWGQCTTLPEAVVSGPVTPIKSLKACPRTSQALSCDWDTCTIVCNKPAKS